jgi:hypothetical protein
VELVLKVWALQKLRPLGRGSLPIDLSTVSYFHDKNYQFFVFDVVKDPVVSDAYSPGVVFSLELFGTSRVGIIGESFDCRANAAFNRFI